MTKINIEDLTIGQVREIDALLGNKQNCCAEHPFVIGEKYFIRTVTHHHTGRLVGVTPTELVLEDAAWIADDGRLTEALKNCNFNEVEMFPSGNQVIIGRGSLIDATQISTIPTSQK